MRIISGLFKGKLINYLKNTNTRPLKDSVKENIFNILHHSKLINTKIEHSNILDLYSGIGSFGIECISRGANKVTFVEQDNRALDVLKKNLVKLSILDKAEIINGKVKNILENYLKKKYNIFFIDPPFADSTFINNLNLIKKKKLYFSNHIVIIHRERGINDDFKNLLKVTNEKKYGRSKIIFGLFS